MTVLRALGFSHDSSWRLADFLDWLPRARARRRWPANWAASWATTGSMRTTSSSTRPAKRSRRYLPRRARRRFAIGRRASWRALCGKRRTVVALGGGAVLREENRQAICACRAGCLADGCRSTRFSRGWRPIRRPRVGGRISRRPAGGPKSKPCSRSGRRCIASVLRLSWIPRARRPPKWRTRSRPISKTSRHVRMDVSMICWPRAIGRRVCRSASCLGSVVELGHSHTFAVAASAADCRGGPANPAPVVAQLGLGGCARVRFIGGRSTAWVNSGQLTGVPIVPPTLALHCSLSATRCYCAGCWPRRSSISMRRSFPTK